MGDDCCMVKPCRNKKDKKKDKKKKDKK